MELDSHPDGCDHELERNSLNPVEITGARLILIHVSGIPSTAISVSLCYSVHFSGFILPEERGTFGMAPW